ncbi:MAG TPA: beta-N-acetylglucosaminidase domain-containing protein, partial [Bacilli bacterium]|nr:beta-N-acetylglucosaminidase domain-containing protein [Bacilli bacterium]
MSRQERHQSKTNRRRKGLLWSLCLLVTLGLLAGGWVGYAAWSKQASQEQPPAGQAPTPEPSPSPTAPAKPSDTQDPDPSTTDPVPASPAPTEPTDPAPAQEDPSPPTHIQGVIEGFYGTPWSQETRIEMMGFLSTHHFNTYVYAPKDDPYQRARWGDLYPAAQAKQMQALIQAAANNGVDFVYSISPGIPQPLPDETLTQEQVAQSISFTSEQDYDRLSAKLAQLQGLGVHTFLLSFDDVERRVKAADQTVYGSNYAQAHIDLANRLLHAGRQQDPQFRLWFAPTTYYGLQDSPYWQAIRSSLDPSIPVIWTGEWVLNKAIGSEQADQVAQLIGRKPLLWDNYPVNDWTYAVQHQPQLLMGPLEHRASDLPAHLDGYLTNPMIQPEASKVALATIGDYLHDPSGYNANPDAFWEQSIRELNGNGDANALLTFCRFSSESSLTD